MTRVPVITDVNIAEGISASLLFPSLIYFFRHNEKYNMYITTLISWFITWIIRKFTVNVFKMYKQQHNEPIKTYYIYLPFSI